MLSDEWLPRYRLLENFNIKWNGNGNGNAHRNGNGNVYDRGDYNSSFALRAVELKSSNIRMTATLNPKHHAGMNHYFNLMFLANECDFMKHSRSSIQP